MSASSKERLPANVWILAASQAFAMCSMPMMILVSGILAAEIAPSEKWATVPIAVVVIGTATSTLWVAWLYQKLGRKKGGFVGFSFALVAALMGYVAAVEASFWLLLLCGYTLGITVAFGQQFRFAALESVSGPSQYGPALSLLMVGGLIAAFVGPELGARGRDLLPSPHGFAGSFALLGAVLLVGMLVFSFFVEPPRQEESNPVPARPLWSILRTGSFLVAAFTATASYAVMSFVMTATPLTMHEICGYGINDTKNVIQGHIAAMFLPSLVGGWLMKSLGPGRLMVIGSVIFCGFVVVGLWGRELIHFWGALIMLGVGWNFLFVSGTALLPGSYRGSERFKVQAANDFVIFGSQSVASLSSGWVLFSVGWDPLLLACVPILLATLGMGIWQVRQERLAA